MLPLDNAREFSYGIGENYEKITEKEYDRCSRKKGGKQTC